jgi:CRP/FNR family cyclic AMP-dependent transcriptional regulator
LSDQGSTSPQPSIATTSALGTAGVFAGLDDADLAAITRVGHEETYAADEAIVEVDDPADGMFVVLEGQARVDVGGRFHILKAGDPFGEIALVAPGKRMATVRAVELVRVLKIPADGFDGFLLEHPRVALAMLKTLAIRLREVEQRIDAWMTY